MKIVKVAISDTLSSFDMLYSYCVPANLQDSISVGVRVSVPFGRGNSLRVGIVLVLEVVEDTPNKYKNVYSIEDQRPILNSEQIRLVYYLVEHTFCTYYEAVKTILPAIYTIKVVDRYYLNEDSLEGCEISFDELDYLDKLRKKRTETSLSNAIEKDKNTLAVKSLIKKGVIGIQKVVNSKSIDSRSKMLGVTIQYLSNSREYTLSDAQKRVVDFILEHGAVSSKEVEYSCHVSKKTIERLESDGIVYVYEYEPTPQDELQVDSSPIVLTAKQRHVYNAIYDSLIVDKSNCYLIHGVTGSGKTAIFERLIQDCIALNKTAILLVPEISLTPQMVKRFKGRFGKRVALIHSGLSLKQREDEYNRILNGYADIVIGTRSAIFVPLQNIGIIIMDEEGDSSYKSERSPRYTTKDIARFRSQNHNATMVLASATPSVESYYLAKKGVYTLLTLDRRYNDSELPSTSIVDMRQERQNGNTSDLSNKLLLELLRNLESNEQSILLLNRRGYNTTVTCNDCGKTIECKKCSVSMTYHKANNSLICHYCGYTIDAVSSCPYCNSVNLRYGGYGTQKVYEEVTKVFPKARVLRVDADTTYSRYSHEKCFSDFSEGKYDIMVGTQMVGKGLDFPNVTLTGIISADSMLYTGDFRSYEKTFSLVTQVIGRCGRGDKLGRAILQTNNPDSYVLNLAVNQDYVSFYNEEIALRRLNTFPPICDICTIGLSSVEERIVQQGCNMVLDAISKNAQSIQNRFPLRVMNPVKFSHERIDGKYRYKIVLKCKNNVYFRDYIRSVMNTIHQRNVSKLYVFVDINGEVY